MYAVHLDPSPLFCVHWLPSNNFLPYISASEKGGVKGSSDPGLTLLGKVWYQPEAMEAML